jgi:hypothetical protein
MVKFSRIILISVFLVSLVSSGFAQVNAVTFGKNRVQYKKFKWQYYQTKNFNVYFYEEGQELAKYVLQTAEAELTDIEYYLGRKDRIVMDDEGVFSSVYGVSSLSPIEPVEPENALSIAIVDIPPYPSLAPSVAKSVGRTDYGVKYKSIDNRRYTMRDIGQLEQRLNRLEYYTSLNLLEKSASDLSITDTNGLDRFKNGILVDAFTGHNVGNVLSNEYHIAIDPAAKEMRPFFFMENVDLQYDSTNSTNITKTG